MKAFHKNFQVIVKDIHTVVGKNAADFIEWYKKVRISLNIYDKAVFRVLQGAPIPSAATDTDGSKLAAWNTANEDLYSVLFFRTKGEACSVVRRFAGKTLDEGSEHVTTRVGRPLRKVRRLFGGSAQSGVRQNELRANESGPRPRRIPV